MFTAKKTWARNETKFWWSIGAVAFDGLPCFAVAPRVGVMDSHTSAWPWSLHDGPAHFSVAPRFRVMDSHALAWPLEFA